MSPSGELPLLHLTLLGEAAMNAECAIFLADDGGRIIAANEAMLEAVGLDRTALATARLNDLVALGSYQAIETEVATLPYILGFFVPETAPKRRRRT